MNNDNSISTYSLFRMQELQHLQLGLEDFKELIKIIVRASGCCKEEILHRAILNTDMTLIKFLVESGPEIIEFPATHCGSMVGCGDYCDVEMSALETAISMCNINMVKYLLDSGANKYAKNEECQTAIEFADACVNEYANRYQKENSTNDYITIAEFVRSYEYVDLPTKGVHTE